jgi:hypothetical protein
LGYSNLHKGFKCLDVGEGRVYISHDVVFDKTVHPFKKLNRNAGAQLRAEILLLPKDSQPSTPGVELFSDSMLDMHNITVPTNSLDITVPTNSQ